MAEAHIEEWQLVGRSNAYFERAEVGEELEAAAQRSIFHPGYHQQPAITRGELEHLRSRTRFADRFAAAVRCFDLIGDNLATNHPWNYTRGNGFATLRTYVRFHHEQASASTR